MIEEMARAHGHGLGVARPPRSFTRGVPPSQSPAVLFHPSSPPLPSLALPELELDPEAQGRTAAVSSKELREDATPATYRVHCTGQRQLAAAEVEKASSPPESGHFLSLSSESLSRSELFRCLLSSSLSLTHLPHLPPSSSPTMPAPSSTRLASCPPPSRRSHKFKPRQHSVR